MKDWVWIALMLGLVAAVTCCAREQVIPPPRVLMVPHVCQPSVDSPAFQKCAADCPNGKAFILENANDTQCVCAKTPEKT